MDNLKVNLLYVITKLELGGAQKQLLSLISGLDKERFRITLFTAGVGCLLSEAQLIPGIRVIRSNFLKRTINPWSDSLAFIEIYRIIKKNHFDIVHTHSSKAGILGRLAAYLADVSVIVHSVHGWSFNDCQSLLKKRFYIWLERIAARFTDKLIVVSEFDRRKGLDNRIGKSAAYRLIRYGINYPDFAKKEGRRNIQELVVGMVACLKPQKSPRDFVKLASLVIQRMPQLGLKFVLVGDGALRPQIEKAIARSGLGEKIILTGWRKDIPKFLSEIDIFVLTSLWEGLPVSVLEAMAASLPVLATDTGGISEVVIDGETGFLVLPKSIDRMFEKLTGLINDRELRMRMGAKAREQLSDNFTIEKMVKETRYLYEDLIRRKVRYAA